MENYGDWWSTTITLYNKVIDENKKVKWYRHVIDDCFYSQVLDTLSKTNSILDSYISICRIRKSENYVGKRRYNDMSDDERENYFTLSSGDIIVAEDVDFEIDEYSDGQRSSDMLKLYREDPGCFIVKQRSNNTGKGRGNPHYVARGE